jgi:uncharacterized membrane protein YfcA
MFEYLLIGILAGTLSGMLGIGGGIIIVPCLIFLFKSKHLFADQIIMQVTAGTSLAIILFTSLASSLTYYKRGLIAWPIFKKFAPGVCLGVVVGGIVSRNISSVILIKAFSILLFLIAMYLMFYKFAINDKQDSTDKALQEMRLLKAASKKLKIYIVSLIVGSLSAIFGIGGGLLMVPFFLSLGLNIRESSGTSAMCTVPIAILATIVLSYTGMSSVYNNQSPFGTIGFIYWPAVLIVSSSSTIFASVGVRLAIYFQPKTLRKILSIILIMTAAQMLFE